MKAILLLNGNNAIEQDFKIVEQQLIKSNIQL
jgi:hypothetical protein